MEHYYFETDIHMMIKEYNNGDFIEDSYAIYGNNVQDFLLFPALDYNL